MKAIQLQNNQIEIRSDEKVVFQSYNTIVCEIDRKTNKVTITDGQPQSKTTAKWLNVFLQRNTQYNNYKEVQK